VDKVRYEFHEEGILDLMDAVGMKEILTEQGEIVANELRSTASEAENGPGGTIDGYADAGFEVIYEARGRRPRVVVKSNAPGDVALAAGFNYYRKKGQLHFLAALYKFMRG
jgi:hypothetical protein